MLGWNQENFTKEVKSEVPLKGIHVVEKTERQKVRSARRAL